MAAWKAWEHRIAWSSGVYSLRNIPRRQALRILDVGRRPPDHPFRVLHRLTEAVVEALAVQVALAGIVAAG